VSFQWPILLGLLAIVPIMIGVYTWSLRRRRPSGARYSSLALIREAQPGSSRVRRHLPFALFLGAVAALVLGLARPVAIVTVPANQTTILLAIDVSRSMCSSDIPPSRLLAAEDAAAAFIQHQGSATRIGIVAFSGFAALIQPPTNDTEVLLDALDSLTTGRRTAIGSGLLAALDAISEQDPSVAPAVIDGRPGVEPAPVAKGAYAPDIIVLLTDGVTNIGPLPEDAAQQAADRGVRVYTIGFGTADGGAFDPACAPQFVGREPNQGGGFGGGGGQQGGGGFRRGIDEDTLKAVAEVTGGTYYPAESAAQLQGVFDGLPLSLIARHEAFEVAFVFVAIGAVLAALAFLLGRAWRPLP
jgi:Ca-activated chloride channel family protein